MSKMKQIGWMMLAAGAAASLASLGGCQKPVPREAFIEPPPLGTRPPAKWNSRTRPVSEAIVLGDRAPSQPAQVVGRARLSANGAGGAEGVAPAVVEGGAQPLIRVKYSAFNQSSVEVFRVLLGEYLGLQYVIDPKATGAVTLDLDDEMTRDDLLDVVGGLCAVYGWMYELSGETVFVRSGDALGRAAAPILQARPAVENDLPAIRVRKMKYVSADQAMGVIKEMMSVGSRAAVSGRSLVLADTARQLGKVGRILAALDVPAFDGAEVWTYRLTSRRPDDAKRVLDEIALGSGLSAAQDPQVVFVPVAGADRLVAICRDATLAPTVRQLVEMVDQPADQTERQRFIYRVQHFDPNSLLTLLRSAFADRIEGEQGTRAPGSTGPGVRLVLDAQEQLMVIQATPDDYADVLSMLRAVDRPRQQVAISSIIAEVGLTNRLEYGVEYFLRALDKDGIGIGELTATPGLPAAATGGAFFAAGDGFAILQALQNESTVDLLSLPQLTVRDGDIGSIQVGGSVPIVRADIDSSSQTDGNTGIRRSIEYRDTGIILRIEPMVNESGEVTLKISEEVTNVGRETDLGPEFTTRKLETKVTVPHGRTVILGGIVDRQDRDTVNKVPIVGDVPLVGLAFQNQNLQDVRTELLLAITPTIINEPSDAAGVYSDFLANASLVRAAMYEAVESLPRGAMFFEGAGDGASMAPPAAPAPPPPAGEPGSVETPRSAAPGAGLPYGAVERGTVRG